MTVMSKKIMWNGLGETVWEDDVWTTIIKAEYNKLLKTFLKIKE